MREGRDRPGKKNWDCFFRCCWGEGKWGADPQNSNHCLPQLLPVAVQIETGQTGDWHSAMPHTSPKWASLPAPATAGNHQPGLSVKAALETWRQRITFLSWSNIFPKISVGAGFHVTEALWRYGTFLRKIHHAHCQLSFSTTTAGARIIDLLQREFNFSEREWLVLFSYIWIHIRLQAVCTRYRTQRP